MPDPRSIRRPPTTSPTSPAPPRARYERHPPPLSQDDRRRSSCDRVGRRRGRPAVRHPSRADRAPGRRRRLTRVSFHSTSIEARHPQGSGPLAFSSIPLRVCFGTTACTWPRKRRGGRHVRRGDARVVQRDRAGRGQSPALAPEHNRNEGWSPRGRWRSLPPVGAVRVRPGGAGPPLSRLPFGMGERQRRIRTATRSAPNGRRGHAAVTDTPHRMASLRTLSGPRALAPCGVPVRRHVLPRCGRSLPAPSRGRSHASASCARRPGRRRALRTSSASPRSGGRPSSIRACPAAR